MSDPYVYPDETNHVYYLTGTGGSQYRSHDLKTWVGPYPIIDLTGTWMEGLSLPQPRSTMLGINTIMPAHGATTAK